MLWIKGRRYEVDPREIKDNLLYVSQIDDDQAEKLKRRAAAVLEDRYGGGTAVEAFNAVQNSILEMGQRKSVLMRFGLLWRRDADVLLSRAHYLAVVHQHPKADARVRDKLGDAVL